MQAVDVAHVVHASPPPPPPPPGLVPTCPSRPALWPATAWPWTSSMSPNERRIENVKMKNIFVRKNEILLNVHFVRMIKQILLLPFQDKFLDLYYSGNDLIHLLIRI